MLYSVLFDIGLQRIKQCRVGCNIGTHTVGKVFLRKYAAAAAHLGEHADLIERQTQYGVRASLLQALFHCLQKAVKPLARARADADRIAARYGQEFGCGVSHLLSTCSTGVPAQPSS